jgi:FADH2 O2-dependent halogenase
MERDWGTPRIPQTLKQYERQTLEELDATERLVGALYASMRDFPLFASISRLYFAAASFSETVQRLDGSDRAGGYLMHDDPQFGPMLRAVCDQARDQPDAFEREELMKRVDAAIEPFDVAGLGRRERRNWYPVDAADLLDAAAKLGASRNTLEQLLRRTGFFPD